LKKKYELKGAEKMKKFYLKTNFDLEGWDIVERNGIQSDEGMEDSIVSTFFDIDKAVEYLKYLNQ
jgi:hypothetical protein